ncbi:MAG: hypothetical protein O7B35_02075 [Deltaproteobacteria bacterium]|nr:hypothetical protein [Deltaproteobacteria bacterium]
MCDILPGNRERVPKEEGHVFLLVDYERLLRSQLLETTVRQKAKHERASDMLAFLS